MKFPLFKNFKATSYLRAFILNAFATAAIAALAIEMRITLQDEKSKMYGYFNTMFMGPKLNELDKIIIVFISAFLGALFVYHIMYALVKFGGGMMISSKKIHYF